MNGRLFCVDCRHCSGIPYPKCMRFTEQSRRDHVLGELMDQFPDCQTERRSRWFFRSRHCGPEGKFWEPKEGGAK